MNNRDRYVAAFLVTHYETNVMLLAGRPWDTIRCDLVMRMVHEMKGDHGIYPRNVPDGDIILDLGRHLKLAKSLLTHKSWSHEARA